MQPTMSKIVPVNGKQDLAKFIDFPHELHKNNVNYVPELFIAQRDLLTPGKHPFFEHSEIQLFLAYDENRIVGRIAAIDNKNHNLTYKSEEGFFGFFDCINDQDVANSLINAAEHWLKQRNLNKMIGPVNFSTNEICALLIEGFDGPPVAMMPYNPPYYLQLLEQAGFEKKVDLHAYRFQAGEYDNRSVQLMERIEERLKRNDIIIRKINVKNFKEESAALREVYNKAWDQNLGFVPMTDKEFDYTAKDLKMLLDPEFCLMAEQNGKIVGFALAIPDVNQIFRKIKKGRLFPTGLIKLLAQQKKIDGIRILLLGVIDGYRKMGIEACLYGRIIRAFEAKKMKYAEASWTLEHNHLINSAIEQIGGKLYRKYRIFEKPILKKKVLITGASGFVGSHLIDTALNENMDVYAAIRPESNVDHLKDLGIKFTQIDFSSIESIKNDLNVHQYDYIIHAAGLTRAKNQEEYNEVNADYSRNIGLAVTLADHKIEKLVYISSLAALGPLQDGLDTAEEERHAKPVTTYGTSKLLAEKYLQEIPNLPLIILRPTAVYGPREKDIYTVIKSINMGLEPYIGYAEQQLSFIYVKDLANLVFLALSSPVHNQNYNVSDGEVYNRYALAHVVKKVLKRKTFKVHFPLPLITKIASILEKLYSRSGKTPKLNADRVKELSAVNWTCSISKAKKDLGFQPQFNLERGLSETVEWYKNNNWL